MADNQPNKPGRKELTMEQRLLLAFVLMGLVLFLTPYFYKTPPPPAKATVKSTDQNASAMTKSAADAPASPKSASPEAASQTAPSQPVPGQIVAPTKQEFVVETDIYRIKLSNR